MPKKVKITVWGYRCERCGHEWVPIKARPPRVCPKCKSPYWDLERRAARASAGAGEEPS
jgi:predicted Zn-ribbon and HTH transcriptional regulator